MISFIVADLFTQAARAIFMYRSIFPDGKGKCEADLFTQTACYAHITADLFTQAACYTDIHIMADLFTQAAGTK